MLPEELVALWPPTAAQAALWMQVLSMEGGRGLHASTDNETVSLFSNFMADAKCRVLFQQGSLSYEEMLAAKADVRYSARVLAGQVFRGATYGLQREPIVEGGRRCKGRRRNDWYGDNSRELEFRMLQCRNGVNGGWCIDTAAERRAGMSLAG